MAAAEANVTELTTKLGEYVEQLGQIEQLLALTPNDPELLELKANLEQIVALTHDLSQNDPAPVPNAAVIEDAKWQVNDRCMALWDQDNKYYAATIVETKEDEITVTYLDYRQTSVVAESNLKPYQPAPADQLESGALIKAIFDEDGLFYDGVIQEKANASGFYIVRFPRFGRQTYEVSSYNIMMREERKKVDLNEPLPEKAVIPESLWAKPTDSEETLLTKKRKIKRIKQQHKKRKLEQEGKRKQANWQSFQKKTRVGFGKRKKSIFATSDTGVVGVIGSGRGMTKNPARKMHQYNEPTLSILDDR